MMRRTKCLSKLVALAPFLVATAAYAAVTPLMFVDSSEKISVPSGLLTAIGSAFPEGVHVGASMLSSTYDPNLIVSEDAQLRVSWLRQGAGYKSALGYFTWTTNGSSVTVVDSQLIFPFCSGSGQPLSLGDTSTLRDGSGNPRVFHAGEHVGFFVVANGWTGSAVAGWNESAPALPSSNPALNDTQWNGGVANGVATSVDALNPENAQGHSELSRHVVLLQFANVPGALSGNSAWVLGFEDMERTMGSDNDFNDVMFQVQAYTGTNFTTPDNTPIGTSQVPVLDGSNPDPDGDGVSGLADYFPNDPTRAFINSTPSTGLDTIAFEDLYPRVGDADFNDAVIQYSIDQVTDSSNNLKQVVGTYHLIARGAGLDHHFGVALHGLPSNATGTIQMETFSKDGVEVKSSAAALPALQQDAAGAWMLRLDDVIPSTRAALPPVTAENGYTNTYFSAPSMNPASVRFIVTFDNAVSTASMGAPPYDPYLLTVHPDGLYDVHRPGSLPFPGRPAGLPAESGTSSFLDADGYPFALLVPSDWRYPLESVRIDGGGRGLTTPYTKFSQWRASNGASQTSWYGAPTQSTPACLTNSLTGDVRQRAWQLSVLQ
jgi:LruC domain-containing protein